MDRLYVKPPYHWLKRHETTARKHSGSQRYNAVTRTKIQLERNDTVSAPIDRIQTTSLPTAIHPILARKVNQSVLHVAMPIIDTKKGALNPYPILLRTQKKPPIRRSTMQEMRPGPRKDPSLSPAYCSQKLLDEHQSARVQDSSLLVMP